MGNCNVTKTIGKMIRTRVNSQRPVVAAALVIFLAACEAPLNLDQVAAEGMKSVRRYDMFQAAAVAGERVVVVSSVGAALLSGQFWVQFNRIEKK